ncbi:ANK_REP_REGION domain-containing protein [Trichoderma simmonsii]|uniref:ANK_REP_REGION domain-containing protein n=1 Tax=Trichoderma simmonsii TaxID=1491479 RepID=A0A8G0PJL6_9HYPO|nr:ANK_REP_REGION domain-containing protein [Trichoderma simmonsii]
MIAEKHGANEYITQEDLDFGLHYAAFGGHLDIVQLFLEQGANMNAHCGKWDSAMHAAVNGGHMNVMEFFVSNGANVDSQPAFFMCFPEQGTHYYLNYLLDRGMSIDVLDEQHGTALHEAITNNNFTLFDLLLERGADVNALSENLGTPLQTACVRLDKYDWREEDSEMRQNLRKPRKLYYIEKLLDCGADPSIRGGKYDTALQAACSTTTAWKMGVPIKAVQLLIEHGADVNAQGGHWGSALHAAAASNSKEKVEMIKLLLDNGAKVDQKGDSTWGTPLHVACHEGTLEAVRFLVDRGADVNDEGGRFGTPILAAAARVEYQDPPKLPILTFLMNKGANINHQGGEYGSVLQAHFHDYVDDIESFLFALKHCADVNSNGGEYGTALIAGCAYPHSLGKECVRLLLDHGADVNVQSDEYGTALVAACLPHDYKDTKMVQWLLEYGIDVNAQGSKHGTALSAACSWNYSEAAELLLNHGANIHLQDCAAWYSATHEIATRDDFGTHESDSSGDAVILELLLDRGIDINHEHAEYGTALHAMMTAEQAGPNWLEGINLLLKHHINPNIMNERLGSALHIACAIKHEAIHADFDYNCSGCKSINASSSKAAYLLEQYPNIDVNAQGGTFGTALQAAAYSGQTLSVRLLLDRKASVNIRDGKYHTALNGAVISGHWNIAKILLVAGAIPDCQLQEEPDEAWLQTVLVEDGRGAVERYRKFWEVELEKKRGEGASNS